MFHTSGHPDVSATLRVARTVVISSPSLCTAGSGRQIARRWHPPTSHRQAGLSTRGRRLATRRPGSRTMPSTTSTALPSLAWPSWTTCTMTASLGTTSRVTTRSRSSARTPRSFSTTWPAPTAASASKALAVSLTPTWWSWSSISVTYSLSFLYFP